MEQEINFTADEILDMKISELIGLKVRFRSEYTGRMNAGVIHKVSKTAANLTYSNGVVRWIRWDNLYKVKE